MMDRVEERDEVTNNFLDQSDITLFKIISEKSLELINLSLYIKINVYRHIK